MSKDSNPLKHDRGPAQPIGTEQPTNADQNMATEAAEHEAEMRKAKKSADADDDNPTPSTTRTPPD